MKRKLTTIGIMLAAVLILVSLIGFTTDRIKLAKEQKVLAGFDTLLAKKGVSAAELIQYIGENIATVSENNAAILVKGLERTQLANLPEWQKKFENEALQRAMAEVYQNSNWTLDNFDNIQDNSLKGIVEEAINNGYKVETAEGFFFPVIDYAFYDKYQDAVTPDLAEYLQIMAVESDQTPVKDAALMIGWEEILNRALRQEEFIRKKANSTQVEAVEELLKRYVTFALFGCNNTPLFSYDNKEMNSEAKEAYLKHTWKEESGSFSTVIKGYLQVLEENDYRLTKEVDEYRKYRAGSF